MTVRPILAASIILASISSAQDGVKAEPLAPRSKPGGKTLFTQLGPETTGVTTLNKMQVEHPMNYLYHSGMTTGGVIAADFDGDGLADLFFGGTTGPNKLYRNLGGLKFEDITAKSAGLDGGERWTSGASAADVDGDGDLDLYLCNYESANQLFLNDGKGIFTEVANAAGLGAVDCSHSAYFADYDGDGDLDVYLLTNRLEDPDGTPKELPVNKLPNGGVEVKKEKERYYRIWRYDFDNWGSESMGTDDRMYRNDSRGGQLKFTDVTNGAGISGRGDGLGAVWLDYDRDGKPDLYVANDFIAMDRLYRNNGNGTFTDVLPEAVPYTSWFSMGIDVGDVNNDLLPDIMVGDMSATSNYKAKTTMSIMGGVELLRAYHGAVAQHMVNCLLINTGTGRFLEGAKLFGVRSTDWTWTVKFADFDLDGWQDLYFTNGISRHMNDSDIKLMQDQLVGRHMFDFFKTGEMRKEMNRSYRNTGLNRFEETSETWGLGHIGVTYGAACADLDNDGDLDIAQVNLEEPNYVLRNDTQNGNRLVLKLVGVKSNTRGIGADVVVKTKSGQQLRQHSPQSGYHAYHEDTVHFGLGNDDTVEELTIRWPGAGEQRLTGLKANMRYTVTQPASGGDPFTQPALISPLFTKSASLDSFKHKDAGWEADFKKQLMLPAAQSQLGPALAWGDVDGDGDDDAFFGGAAGEISQLRANDGRGRLTAKWVEDFRKDKPAEDMGAVFFDADGDGDLDLYVASGSSEFDAGARELGDRLYLNDGKGGFTSAPSGAVPADTESDGPVAAVDYDHDGKVDLFVGARSVPGAYPRAGKSRLLRNESNKGSLKFTSIPGFADMGIVNAALWTDVDGDGWHELIVAAHWRPVRLFKNTKGKLIEDTAAAGLTGITGWWNSIAAGDFDGDGDLDYAVGNAGLNTKYQQPTAQQPLVAFDGDFDNSGKRHFIETRREGTTLYMDRSRLTAADALPFIRNKFPTFKQFALASIGDVLGEAQLKTADKYEANELQSGVFWNDGGKFTFKALDPMAQISPIYGMVAADLNADGVCDLFVSQNTTSSQIETPRLTAGLSDVLLSDGKGALHRADHRKTGIMITGEAKSATLVDLNGDGRPDLGVTRNNDTAIAFESTSGRWLRVNLPAAKAAGARVTLTRAGKVQVVEYAAGSGYLGQNVAAAFLGLGSDTSAGNVKVQYTDGTSSDLPFDGKTLTITATPKKNTALR